LERAGAPGLIWSTPVATTKSAISASSVSSERWESNAHASDNPLPGSTNTALEDLSPKRVFISGRQAARPTPPTHANHPTAVSLTRLVHNPR
jgi:hypothetical protein